MLIEKLLHDLEFRKMCEEITVKKPVTFTKAYEIAQTLVAQQTKSKQRNHQQSDA